MNLTIVSMAMLIAVSPAAAEIYQRVDGFGNVTYTNLPRKGAPEGAEKRTSQPLKSLSDTAVSPSKEFPHVSVVEQRNRDSDRRRILEEELKSEQERLAAAIAKKNVDDIARRSADIDSIKQELTRVK